MAKFDICLIAAIGVFCASSAFAEDAAINTTKSAAKTGGNAVVDGSRTAGRTVRAFFKGGVSAAKKTAHENAKVTKEHAKQGSHATTAAAK